MSWCLPLSWGLHPRRAPAGLWRQPLFLTKGLLAPRPSGAQGPPGIAKGIIFRTGNLPEGPELSCQRPDGGGRAPGLGALWFEPQSKETEVRLTPPEVNCAAFPPALPSFQEAPLWWLSTALGQTWMPILAPPTF